MGWLSKIFGGFEGVLDRELLSASGKIMKGGNLASTFPAIGRAEKELTQWQGRLTEARYRVRTAGSTTDYASRVNDYGNLKYNQRPTGSEAKGFGKIPSRGSPKNRFEGKDSSLPGATFSSKSMSSLSFSGSVATRPPVIRSTDSSSGVPLVQRIQQAKAQYAQSIPSGAVSVGASAPASVPLTPSAPNIASISSSSSGRFSSNRMTYSRANAQQRKSPIYTSLGHRPQFTKSVSPSYSGWDRHLPGNMIAGFGAGSMAGYTASDDKSWRSAAIGGVAGAFIGGGGMSAMASRNLFSRGVSKAEGAWTPAGKLMDAAKHMESAGNRRMLFAGGGFLGGYGFNSLFNVGSGRKLDNGFNSRRGNRIAR